MNIRKERNKDKRHTRPTKTKQTDTCLDNYYFLTNELIHPGTFSVGVRWTEKHEKMSTLAEYYMDSTHSTL